MKLFLHRLMIYWKAKRGGLDIEKLAVEYNEDGKIVGFLLGQDNNADNVEYWQRFTMETEEVSIHAYNRNEAYKAAYEHAKDEGNEALCTALMASVLGARDIIE